MNISKALEIPGWMEPEELEWLAFEAARHKAIVEIGSYCGRSARALADNADGIVYCVDDWYGPREFTPVYPREQLYGIFCDNNKDHIESGKIVPIKCPSLEAVRQFVGIHPDMVFVDGSHDHDSVRRDLEAWSQVITPGGLFCGHDAHWQGVAEARRLQLPPHMTGVGSIWAADNFQGLKP